jgi:hypothetical protein
MEGGKEAGREGGREGGKERSDRECIIPLGGVRPPNVINLCFFEFSFFCEFTMSIF